MTYIVTRFIGVAFRGCGTLSDIEGRVVAMEKTFSHKNTDGSGLNFNIEIIVMSLFIQH